MAGFLDKNNRIMDVVLTGEGKYLLSKGELRFVYWVPFDNEVDYDPFLTTTGSLTAIQKSASIDEQIENSPVREATTGYRRMSVSGSDTTNLREPLFTVPQGLMVVPRMTGTDGPTGSIDIEVKQQKVSELFIKKDPAGNVTEQLGPYERGFERFDTSVFVLGYGYTRAGFPLGHPLDGFLVKVYRSGADGLTEVDARRDMNNELAFNNDLALVLGDAHLGDADDE